VSALLTPFQLRQLDRLGDGAEPTSGWSRASAAQVLAGVATALVIVPFYFGTLFWSAWPGQRVGVLGGVEAGLR